MIIRNGLSIRSCCVAIVGVPPWALGVGIFSSLLGVCAYQLLVEIYVVRYRVLRYCEP